MPKISEYPNGGRLLSTDEIVIARGGRNYYLLGSGASALPSGFLFGLTLSNSAGDATNDISVATGRCRDSSDTDDMILASALVKRLDAAWAVGTNQGGLDTGVIANTTYFIWLIKRSDTGVVDALFSASATAPTMPASYDYKRRIGAILRESGAIVPFVQDGDYFMRKIPIRSSSVNNQAVAASLITLHVPVGIRVRAILILSMNDLTSAATVCWLVTDPSQTDSAPGATLLTLDTVTISAGAPSLSMTMANIFTNTSAQIRSRVDTQLADLYLNIHTQGWMDDRGRNS